jgi:NAD(P)H dehydrogenase (quinone)
MGKILVTGASGYLGRKTLQHLLKRKPASDLAGLARNPAKAADLAAQGIDIRQGDYFDDGALLRAFEGIEKVMLIGTHGFTDRNTQHYNVIAAARQAGVKHIAFTSIIRKENSDFILPEVTVTDIFAEQALKASGIPYTIVRQPAFLEVLQFFIGGKAYEAGVRVPAGDGKIGALTRGDIAEAQAVVLAEDGHQNKVYSLTGDPCVSFAGLARILSELRGVEVPYIKISDQQYIDNFVADGLPEPVAAFALGWVRGINRGEWEDQTRDLENLIGHKPVTAAEFLRDNYPVVIREIEALRVNKAA